MKMYLITTRSGTYYARFEQPDGKWTTRSLRTTNEADAKVALGELSLRLKQQGWDPPTISESPTLAQIIPTYLAHISRRKSYSWTDKQKNYLYGPMGRFFGLDTKVGMISPGRIENYANNRCDDVRGVTVNRELSCLRSFFKYCKTKGYIINNPASQVEFMDDEVQIVRRFLTLNEYDVLYQTAERIVHDDPYFHIGNRFRDLPELLAVGCHTGLRLGELLHIEYQDIVHNTLLVRPKPHYNFRLKNHQERQIPLDTIARNAFQTMTNKRTTENPLVFWNDGEPLKKGTTGLGAAYNTHKRDVQESFSKLVETATKEQPTLYDVGPHTMRKTFGSWAVQGGASLQQVKELLGHSTIMITERHYAYLSPKNLQDAVSKLEDFVMKTVMNQEKTREGE
jgi:integrase